MMYFFMDEQSLGTEWEDLLRHVDLSVSMACHFCFVLDACLVDNSRFFTCVVQTSSLMMFFCGLEWKDLFDYLDLFQSPAIFTVFRMCTVLTGHVFLALVIKTVRHKYSVHRLCTEDFCHA